MIVFPGIAISLGYSPSTSSATVCAIGSIRRSSSRAAPLQRGSHVLVIDGFDAQVAAAGAPEQEVQARAQPRAAGFVLDGAQQLLDFPDLAVDRELGRQEAGVFE